MTDLSFVFKDSLPAWLARDDSKSHPTKQRSNSYYRKLWRATPEWAEEHKIKLLYEMAKKHGYHVDHVYPVNSDFVCGLHVFKNLQLLRPVVNKQKSNKMPGQMEMFETPNFIQLGFFTYEIIPA